MAKKKAKRAWVWAPGKPAAAKVPDDLKSEVEAKAKALIESFLRPTFVKSPPEDPRWNYLTDVSTKWHGAYFYFVGTYACPEPNAISPTFESGFARLEYAGLGKFNLAYMHHTGKYVEIFQNLTLEEALDSIRDGVWFHPV